MKLYTAEWYNGSRGWRLDDEMCKPFLEKCKELGIKNVHVHKGPTIWPLDKDAFDHRDVDQAATDNPELNFIIEHVGHPADRGLLLHGDAGAQRLCRPVGRDRRPDARPPALLRARSWASCCSGSARTRCCSARTTAIWEPKWQIDGFLDWNYPDDAAYSDYPR